MSHSVALPTLDTPVVDTPVVPPVPLRELTPWAIFFGMLALVALFFVSAEQGTALMPAESPVIEFLHDGRHLLGFPGH
ncbi:MAG: CbtB domain-containing protein [Dermatophilaceae bacterium]